MRTNVWPLLVGVAVLGSAGAVDAADVAAPVEKKVVVLTDTQMDGIVAGFDPDKFWNGVAIAGGAIALGGTLPVTGPLVAGGLIMGAAGGTLIGLGITGKEKA